MTKAEIAAFIQIAIDLARENGFKRVEIGGSIPHWEIVVASLKAGEEDGQ